MHFLYYIVVIDEYICILYLKAGGRDARVSNSVCRHEGCANLDPFATERRNKSHCPASLYAIPYEIAVGATERSLSYGRFCGEVAIKVIRLGSISVKSLFLAA